MTSRYSARTLALRRLISTYPNIAGFVLVAAVYVVFYAALIAMGNGLPYVMDNNETFSSLWHARNMLEHGLERSAGLADEVFSPHSEAHPYVHTHQGNFPRLFAVAIYALGATSAESQILVTTFTVGLAATLMGYLLFSRIGGTLFATVCMLIMVTDYIVIAQWQVVTYRVWHMFFVFSSLLSVHAATEMRHRYWTVLVALNFACLAYFELVFAAFVFGMTALYALGIYFRSPKRVVAFWLLQFAGFFVGLGILVYQLTLYLGWDGLKQDFFLTFAARNQFKGDQEVVDALRAFYEGHRVIFWYNLQDGSELRSIGHFIASITFYDFQPHTPLLTGFAALFGFALLYKKIVAMADPLGRAAVPALIGTISNSAFLVSGLFVTTHFVHKLIRVEFGWMQWLAAGLLLAAITVWGLAVVGASRGWIPDRVGSLLLSPSKSASGLALVMLIAILPSVIPHASFEPVLKTYSWLYVAILTLYAVLVVEFSYRFVQSIRNREKPGIMARLYHRGYVVNHLVLMTVFGASALFLATATDVSVGVPLTLADARWTFWAALAAAIVVAAAASYVVYRHHGVVPHINLLLAIGVAILGLFPYVYNQGYRDLWWAIIDGAFPRWSVPFLTISAIGVAVYVASRDGNNDLFVDGSESFRRFILFCASGIGAYAVVFALSPGYIFTGYRFRLVPFTAFHTVALYGLMFAILVRLAWDGSHLTARSGSRQGLLMNTWHRLARIGAAVLSITMVFYWTMMQITYIRLFPPDHFSVFQRLQHAPYRNESFAANSYAAPIAAYTGQWAYMDAKLNQAIRLRGTGGVLLARSDEYLWFADRDVNTTYERPRYYLCLAAQAMPSVRSYLRGQTDKSSYAGCEGSSLVKLAMSPTPGDVIPKPRLVEIDGDGPTKVGFVRWAIIELTWP